MSLIARDTYNEDDLDLSGFSIEDGTATFDGDRTVGYVIDGDDYEADPLRRGAVVPGWYE